VRIEGDDNGGAVVLGGVLLSGADHLLVAEVEAVENANSERQRAGKGGKSPQWSGEPACLGREL
jgi:hypothetical protein